MAGRLILQVSATDADIRSNAHISYELQGLESELFFIDSETGMRCLWYHFNLSLSPFICIIVALLSDYLFALRFWEGVFFLHAFMPTSVISERQFITTLLLRISDRHFQKKGSHKRGKKNLIIIIFFFFKQEKGKFPMRPTKRPSMALVIIPRNALTLNLLVLFSSWRIISSGRRVNQILQQDSGIYRKNRN